MTDYSLHDTYYVVMSPLGTAIHAALPSLLGFVLVVLLGVWKGPRAALWAAVAFLVGLALLQGFGLWTWLAYQRGLDQTEQFVASFAIFDTIIILVTWLLTAPLAIWLGGRLYLMRKTPNQSR